MARVDGVAIFLLSFLWACNNNNKSCCSCWALSSSASPPTPTTSSNADDIRFDEWCDGNGIVRVNVQTITTSKSLGGRGLFATKSMKSGSVVASIPANLIIAARDKKEEDEEEWQVSLTTKVLELLQDEKNEWIQSWRGSDSLDIASLLCNPSDEGRVKAHIESMAGKGCITLIGAKQEMQSRFERYARRLERLRLGKYAKVDESEISHWYALVIQDRHIWEKIGIINVDLFPFLIC